MLTYFLKRKKVLVFFLITSLLIQTLPVSAQPTISVYTDKQIYSYGDFLTFTIEVSEITEKFATLYITDEDGKKSSAIPLDVTDLKTTVPSPFPFESEIYPLGKYTLEVQYSGNTATTEFELIDSGKIVIPSWIREFSKYWYNGAITDLEFANAIAFLIKEEIIVVQNIENQENSGVTIPDWVKISTGWWIDRKISDQEYAKSIEYLIKVGIISI